MQTRPAWAHVNLDYLAHNIQEVRRVTKKEAMICAVIKADGYGHGAVHIAQTLIENGADRLAVATLSEAIQLRRNFKSIPILILGYTPESMAKLVLDHNLIQTIWDYKQASVFDTCAKERDQICKVHLKLDTGMSRVGFLVDDKGKADVVSCYGLENLEIEGVYTHFACADELDKTVTHQQVEKYLQMISHIEKSGYRVPIKHVCNSAGIIDLPEYHFDMVRAGIMLYGLYPSKDVLRSNVDLKEVMSLKAMISLVKQVPKGTGVSYGHIYHAKKDETIGTLPLGYADGFTRLLTGKTTVLVKGLRVPVVGKICMDQCMIQLPDDADIKRDDIVTLYGEDGNAFISIDDIAQLLGTINYEVVCMLNKRIPRHYYREGKLVKVYDAVLMGEEL